MVKSKKSIFGFYLPVLSEFIFYIFVSGLIIYSCKDETNTLKFIFYYLLLVPLFAYIGFYTLYSHLRNAYNLFIDSNKILVKNIFNRKELQWNEIDTIRLTGKTSHKNILIQKKEASVIYLKSGEKIEIIDRYYSNTHKIKYTFSSILSTGKLPVDFNENPVQNNDFVLESGQTYKNNPFLNFYTFLIISLACFIIFQMITSYFQSKQIIWQIPILILPFIYMYLSYGSFYFIVNDKYLLVKNHFIPFLIKVYPLNQIEEIVFDGSGNIPMKKLMVVTKKFRTYTFHASSLRNKTWGKLKEKFSEKEIKIRVEQ